jgi:excisionase family DNA binding protein
LDMNELLSVDDAARELKVDPSRVRALAANGQLDAVKIGNSWAIYRSAVAARAATSPGRGRPVKPENAWTLLSLAAGVKPSWASQKALSRLSDLLRMRGLKGLAPRMSQRADVRYFRAHPGEIKYILNDPVLMRSGVSAAAAHGLDLVSGREADGYIPHGKLDHFRKEHALEAVERRDANVVLRVVPDKAWHRDLGEVAPLPAVALDLLVDPDPRSSRAGQQALKRIDARLPELQEEHASAPIQA